MKTIKTITALSLGSAFLCGLLFTPRLASGDEKRELATNMQKASEVIGKNVENESGERLGRIEEVVIEASSARVAYAVLSFGGFLGFGDKLFAIPWQALKEDNEKKVCLLSVDKERLKNAPGFDKKSWPDMSRPEFRDEIYRFYNVSAIVPAGTAPAGGLGRGDWDFAQTELRREAVQLPLNLKEGMTLRYRAIGHSHGTKEVSKESSTGPARPVPASASTEEADVYLRVATSIAGEATVAITCNCKEASAKSCTARVSRDGTVTFEPPEKADRPGEKHDEARAQLAIRHIFGQGLHHQKLEPGKEYSMPGSLSKQEPGSAGADGFHLMRFEGVAKRDGKTLVVFTIAPGAAELRAGTPGRIDPTGARLGRAAYRLDDGLLELLSTTGCSLRRIEGALEEIGN